MIVEHWQTLEYPKAQDVANDLGVSVHQVYKALRARGCSPGKGKTQKVPYPEIERTYLQYRSQKKTAAVLGVDEETVGRALDRLGYGSRRKGYQIKNPTPLEVVRDRNSRGETMGQIARSLEIDESTLRRRMEAAGIPIQNHGQAKGKDSVLYNEGKGSVRSVKAHKEARLIGATCLGHPLAKEEVIHHMDNNPENNAIENLWYFPTNSLHTGYHNKLKRRQHAGLQVNASQLARDSGGVPLLEFASQSEELPDKG